MTSDLERATVSWEKMVGVKTLRVDHPTKGEEGEAGPPCAFQYYCPRELRAI